MQRFFDAAGTLMSAHPIITLIVIGLLIVAFILAIHWDGLDKKRAQTDSYMTARRNKFSKQMNVRATGDTPEGLSKARNGRRK